MAVKIKVKILGWGVISKEKGACAPRSARQGLHHHLKKERADQVDFAKGTKVLQASKWHWELKDVPKTHGQEKKGCHMKGFFFEQHLSGKGHVATRQKNP